MTNDWINALDRGMILSWHARRKKHQRLMIEAEKAVVNAEILRDDYPNDAVGAVAGWEYMTRAISAVVRCGCPADLWPERVRQAIPSR